MSVAYDEAKSIKFYDKKGTLILKSIFLIYEQSLDFLNAYCLRPL